ncbi:hypothetical protein AM1_H0015 (plasmid) [Acaryochloris marina MBIC11017]|uniref:Uncharacterized protein n=1 Tax=Acaryochloris marina (strain MBIC 11017) TaxID=329726 RepID=A8ZQT2_ACAM1|nr:hypothetical protein AM1_H0015 [Acaryochloris marina MBIC11017]
MPNPNPKHAHLKPQPRADNSTGKLSKSISIRLEQDVYESLSKKYSGSGELRAWLRKVTREAAEKEGLL